MRVMSISRMINHFVPMFTAKFDPTMSIEEFREYLTSRKVIMKDITTLEGLHTSTTMYDCACVTTNYTVYVCVCVCVRDY